MSKTKEMKQAHPNEDVYIEILNLFCGKAAYRKWMEVPFCIDNLAIATDTFELVFFDKYLLKTEISPVDWDKPENILRVITKDRNVNFKLDIEQIERALKYGMRVDVLKAVGEDIECKECDGQGEVLWTYEHWQKEFDCPNCDGTGFQSTSKKVPTGELELDPKMQVRIKECRFSLSTINRLMKVKNMLGEDEITLVYQKRDNTKCIFNIGSVEIICMSLRFVDNDEDVILRLS